MLSSLPPGGSYIVTPTKSALTPGSAGINTVDVIATQRHFLNIALLPIGCRRDAADVNGDTMINTVDVIGIQRFYLGMSTGIANSGKYRFTPVNRAYPGLFADQTGENYDTLVFGDVASEFVHTPENPFQSPVDDDATAEDVRAKVTEVALPNVGVDPSATDFVLPVTTRVINADDRLVGFQGDFTFDESVVTFQKEPVQKAGLTAANWNVAGNVLDGLGPIRTLRISAYSNDFTPLSGSGTLFELRMNIVKGTTKGTKLLWAVPPDEFIFIDADLNMKKPGYLESGSVTLPGKRK